MAGFKSEWGPTSSRYRGRLRVGIPGRIKSESATWEPSLRGSRLTVWQQTDRLASLKIANDRSVSLVSPPCPIVDPDYTWRGERLGGVKDGVSRRRTTRSSVSLPTGSISLWAKLAAERPSRASPDDERHGQAGRSAEPTAPRHCR
jgi:hypothetical protein